MNTISYILKNTMQLGLMALLVVFQPELRRALEHVGSSKLKFFGRFGFDVSRSSEESIRTAIKNVCAAVEDLSRSRTGALIVFENETRLNDIAKTGVEIDSSITPEILKNIFYPKAPLHDGAVIIRGDRIVAASCLLPLTQNKDLSKELGTRHRAAIGMSEAADVVVVVVSEETGKISVARNGEIKRNLTTDVLEKDLLKRLLPEGGKKDKPPVRAKAGREGRP